MNFGIWEMNSMWLADEVQRLAKCIEALHLQASVISVAVKLLFHLFVRSFIQMDVCFLNVLIVKLIQVMPPYFQSMKLLYENLQATLCE